MPVTSPFISPREAAGYCRCRQASIEALIARGQLPLCTDITGRGRRLVDVRLLDKIMSPTLDLPVPPLYGFQRSAS